MASFVSLSCPSCCRRNLPRHEWGMLYETETAGRWRCPKCQEIFILVGDDGGHVMEAEPSPEGTWRTIMEGHQS